MLKDNVIQFHPQMVFTTKNLVVVHPHPEILNQLVTKFQDLGFSVFAFKRVKDANAHIFKMHESRIPIHRIIVPKLLWVAYNFTYKQFLNHMVPDYQVVTVDEKDYRDTIDLKKIKRIQYV